MVFICLALHRYRVPVKSKINVGQRDSNEIQILALPPRTKCGAYAPLLTRICIEISCGAVIVFVWIGVEM